MKGMVVFFFGGCLFLSGCASTSVYKEVMKEKKSYNTREFSVPAGVLYQGTVKVFCGKNFLIENEDEAKGFILAKRPFQKGKRSIVLVLQGKITSEDANRSMLYLNAFQVTEKLYVADRTRFFLWVVPLPGGGGKEAAKIKESEKMIEDKKFYRNLFADIEASVKNMEAKPQ